MAIQALDRDFPVLCLAGVDIGTVIGELGRKPGLRRGNCELEGSAFVGDHDGIAQLERVGSGGGEFVRQAGVLRIEFGARKGEVVIGGEHFSIGAEEPHGEIGIGAEALGADLEGQ